MSLVAPVTKARKRETARLLREARLRGLEKPLIEAWVARIRELCKAKAIERASGIA